MRPLLELGGALLTGPPGHGEGAGSEHESTRRVLEANDVEDHPRATRGVARLLAVGVFTHAMGLATVAS